MFLGVKSMFHHAETFWNESVLLTDCYFTDNLAHIGAAVKITADSSSELLGNHTGCSMQSGKIVLASVVFDNNIDLLSKPKCALEHFTCLMYGLQW